MPDAETETRPRGEVIGTVENGIGWVTFSNPTRYNALSFGMVRSIPPLLQAMAADPEVKVLVVTGAGDKAFVSGADISEFGERRTGEEARAEYDGAQAEAEAAWAGLEKPVIAKIRGFCLGGGLRLALQADIRIAAEGSQFAVPAARLGLGYGLGAVEQLVQIVGPSWAAEILFSARRLSADEGLRSGLVNRLVPADQLDDTVLELATTIAGNAPLTVRAAKAAIQETARNRSDLDRSRVRDMVEACFRSEDYKEGQRAFLDKRPPVFRGR